MMRILVISKTGWDITDSTGNSFSNWFEDWEETVFYHIYIRNNTPNNNCVDKYLSVTPQDILKNFFTPWKIGKVFTKKDIENRRASGVSDKHIQSYSMSGTKRSFALMLMDLLYSLKLWRNNVFKQFVKEANPDIVFLSIMPDAYCLKTLEYIKKNTSAKIVEFISDDMYGKYIREKGLLFRIYKKRFLKILRLSDALYGASQEMCDNYESICNKELKPLYKGCTLAKPRPKVNSPIKMMYAGNLRFGRYDTLLKLSQIITSINKRETKIVLDIYSNTIIEKEDKEKLEVKGSVILHDVQPYDRILELLKESDIVLHVESFELDQIMDVRYSFSTKIIDCLQSGATLLVIGPKGIASVEYPRKINGTIVIDNIEDVESVLQDVIVNEGSLPERAKKINEYAMRVHSIESVRRGLKKDFCNLLIMA